MFLTASKLATHMQVHSSDKKHVCGTCGARFNNRSNLNRHAKLHSGKDIETVEPRQTEHIGTGKNRSVLSIFGLSDKIYKEYIEPRFAELVGFKQ